MAKIWREIYIDVDAEEWFSDSRFDEKVEMYNLCKKYFVESHSIQEQEFRDKLDELAKRYISLSPEEISIILSL